MEALKQMFYDWFVGVIADSGDADHHLALVSALVFSFSWLWCVWLLVIQTGRKMFSWLIIPVLGFTMWALQAQPEIFHPLTIPVAIGLIIAGAIVARGTMVPSHKIAGAMAVVAGVSMALIPMANEYYAMRQNHAQQLAMMANIARLDDARFFMLCQKWRLSCGQPAIPETGVPAHDIDPQGVIRFYAPHGTDQMRVIIDRQNGQMIRDAFLWATALQRLAVLGVWWFLAIIVGAGHRILFRSRGLPHSAKPAT